MGWRGIGQHVVLQGRLAREHGDEADEVGRGSGGLIRREAARFGERDEFGLQRVSHVMGSWTGS